MPSKNQDWDALERKARRIDARTAEYEASHPNQPRLSAGSRGLKQEQLAVASRPMAELVAERRACAMRSPEADLGASLDSDSGALTENPKLQNEIELESERAPKPRRKRGQKTPEGQIIASRNATKHGIMSNAPVVDGFETMDAWELHCASVVDDINPVGALEEKLASRLASILWRLNRVIRHENAAITLAVAARRRVQREQLAIDRKNGRPPARPALLRAQLEFRLLPGIDSDGTLLKYESSLHRQSLQIMHEIEARQARRRGEGAPLARVDVSQSPS